MAAIAQLVLAASAAVGAYVAWRGLHTWKAQVKGQNSYELARRLLRAVYEVRDEIYTVRGPMMLAGEIAEALKEAGFEDEENGGPRPHPDADRAVYQMRWKGLAEVLSDLQVEEREAEVLWEKDRREMTADLHRCVSDLWYAVWQHLRHQTDNFHANLDPEELRELEDVLYMTSRDPDEDEFTGQVEEAVQKIETDLRPYLKIS